MNWRITIWLVVLLSLGLGMGAVIIFRGQEHSSSDEGWSWVEDQRNLYHGIPSLVRFRVPSQTPSQDILAKVWQEFERVGGIFNSFADESEVGRLNADVAKSQTVVSQEFVTLLELSRAVANESQGAFDPTLWPLKLLWNAAMARQVPPTEQELAAVLARTGVDKVLVNDQQTLRFTNPQIQFDFGGIVKGYAVDRVVSLLREAGADAALVQCGGEISTFGANRDNGVWRIGIQDPKRLERLWASFEVEGEVHVSTSGNYRQPIVIAGESYYHIFSPATGKPVSQRVLGITAVRFGSSDRTYPNAWLDGLTTAATVLGVADAMTMGRRLGVELVALEEEGGSAILATSSDGIRERLNLILNEK